MCNNSLIYKNIIIGGVQFNYVQKIKMWQKDNIFHAMCIYATYICAECYGCRA